MRYRLTILLLSMICCGALAGQSVCKPEIRLLDVDVNRNAGFVNLRLLARADDCAAMIKLQADDLLITESIAGGPANPLEIVSLSLEERYDTLDLNEEEIDVHFLVDVSQRGRLAASTEMITTFLQRHRGAGANYTIRTYAGSIDEARKIDAEQPQMVLNTLRQRQEEPHLYGALLEQLRDIEGLPNKQLLFVFSRGDNVAPDYADLPKLPPRAEDLYRAAKAHGDNLYLFTIATSPPSTSSEESILGGDAGAEHMVLQELPGRTARSDDGYAVGRLPDAVAEIFSEERRLLSTHRLNVRTSDPLFKGRERRYTVREAGQDSIMSSLASISKGSYNEPFVLGRVRQGQAWLKPTLIGLTAVGGLLAIFYFLVPQIRRRKFRTQHVKPYQPEHGRLVLDPLTREPIPPGAAVVDICSMVVPLETWRDCGDQCPHYPGCTNNNLQCDGAGRGHSLNFFALHGVNRRLNWIWFGALGGFVGWVLYALLVGLGGSLITGVAANFPGFDNAETLLRETLLGACFGMGLTLLLAIMSERSESRRLSIRRVLGRTLLGGLTATLAFGLGFVLREAGIIQAPIVAAAISWVFFGLGLGTVLSLGSSIDIRRGVVGGFLSGLLGFAIFTLFGNLLGGDLIPKVLSLLVTGALLGLVLDTVVKLAENYEMEYVAPANYRRRVPLSKWLKNEWNIMIGSQPGSQVYIKWPDEEVLPEHAQIRLDGGRVYLIPQGETLINGEIVNNQKRTQLESGDLIQLGRRGMTQMRFWQR